MAGPWRRNCLIFYQCNRCYLCGHTMLRKKRKNDKKLWRTTEHIMPLSLGGARGGANVAMAHQGCNNKKGDRYPHPCEIFLGEILALRIGESPL